MRYRSVSGIHMNAKIAIPLKTSISIMLLPRIAISVRKPMIKNQLFIETYLYL